MPITWDFDNVVLHPAAEAFPMLTTEDFDSLVEDIRVNGLRRPISRMQDGRIISGRNRYAACQKLGITPTYTMYKGNPWTFVIHENLPLRSLTEQQRAMIGARMVFHSRPQNLVPTRLKLADLLGISARAIARATVVVKKGTDEVITLVDDNLMTLTTGERIAYLAPEDQRVVAEKIRAGTHTRKVAPHAPVYGSRDAAAKRRKEGAEVELPLKVATTTASFLEGIAAQLEGKEVIASPEDLRDARLIDNALTRGALALRKVRHLVKHQITLMERASLEENINE